MSPRGAVLAAVLMTLAVTGCGELTAGGAGDVEIEIISDTIPVTVVTSPLEGTLTVGVQIFVRRGSREFELTDGVQVLDLALGGGSSEIVSRRTLPAGRYTGGRLLFRKVEADVEGGLVVDGQPFAGEVDVELGPGAQISVPWDLELEVEDGRTERLILEMRAPRWLRLLNRDLRRVPREDFEANAPTVRIAPADPVLLAAPR